MPQTDTPPEPTHLWDDEVTGYFGAMGAIADGKISGSEPLEVRFEAARADPRATLDRALAFLGLDPLPPGAIPADSPRYFTARASNLFKMDAWSALESVTENCGDDAWEGECQPCP